MPGATPGMTTPKADAVQPAASISTSTPTRTVVTCSGYRPLGPSVARGVTFGRFTQQPRYSQIEKMRPVVIVMFSDQMAPDQMALAPIVVPALLSALVGPDSPPRPNPRGPTPVPASLFSEGR